MENIIIITVVAGLIGLAVWYIVKEKKSGKKCVGCPYADGCKTCNCKKEHNNTS